MKRVVLLALILMSVSFVSAINLNIEQQDPQIGLMIKDTNKPAEYNLKITNLGSADSFEFYNLIGFQMLPQTPVEISSGETKDVQLIFYPREGERNTGFFTIKYYIRGQDDSQLEQELTIEIINLADAFKTGAGDIDPKTNEIEVYLENKNDISFENLDVEFKSAFFEIEKIISLAPNEKQTFKVQLNKEDFKSLMAGFYTLTTTVTYQDVEAKVEGNIKFVESDIITTNEKTTGFIITTKTIEKINKGNLVAESSTTIKKNIISRVFSSFSDKPDIVERDGLTIYYTWNRNIDPGETLKIEVRTNWLLPLLIITLIVTVVILTKQYSKTNLVLRKKVSFVKAKGGEFALKVSIIINAKKYLEKVSVTDRLPQLAKLYERFGGEQPARINEKTGRIEWNFEKLEAGEMRMLSYIIYSKVGVLGKFALPTATAVYEREGEIHESESNRAYFVAEQVREKFS